MGRKADPERGPALRDWEAVFGKAAPPYLSVGFMQQAVSYERQCKKRGGLPTATRKALAQIASGGAVKTEVLPPTLSPGAHLVREWNGRSYQVTVVPGGYEMDGKTWRSLSAIARHITGANWSGPRFFGLRSAR